MKKLQEGYERELTRIRRLLVGSPKGLTVTEISRSLGINRNSVAKYLDVLLTSGVVERKLVGSAKIFSLTKRIPISSILSLSSDYILVLDDDLIISYVNDNVLNFEKKAFGEIVGKTVDAAQISILSVPEIRALLKDGIGGREITKEFEIEHGENTFIFRAKFVPSILENGKKGLMIILEDISEIRKYQQGLEKTVAEREAELTSSYLSLKKEINGHKEAEDAFKESDRRYQNLIELAQEGMWTISPEANTTFINHKMSEILGYNPEEIIGKPIFAFIDEKDKKILKQQVNKLKSGSKGFYELTFIKKDGSPAFTRISASPSIDDKGNFEYGLFLVSDITDLKKADDALRESEQYYRTIIESSPNGLLMFDLEGNIRMGNVQAAKLLGYKSTNELVGKNVFDYVSPNDLEKYQSNLKKAVENGYAKNAEFSLISKDNAAFCADLSISILRNRIDSPIGFVSVISDITERRKADYLLRKSEEKHRSLVEGISHIIFTTDVRGRYTYVSPVIQRILGYTPDELIGQHIYTLVPSEERHKLGTRLKEAQSGKVSPYDFKMMDKSGAVHWVRITAQPLKEGNKLVGITGLIGDIDDWKRTEDALQKIELQYKAVVEDQDDLICRFLPNLTIVFVNPAYCKSYHKTQEELIDQPFLSIVPAKSRKAIEKLLGGLTIDHPVDTYEHEVTSPEGDILWHHLKIHAIFDAKAQIMEYQSSSRDLTELKRYFERSHKLFHELKIHEAELETQNEELRQLREETVRSEKKYLDLFDSAPIGYFTLDQFGKIINVNKTGATLIGKARDELINKPFKDFIAGENLNDFMIFCERVFETGKKQTVEVTLLRHKNTPLTIHVEGKSIESYGTEERQCRIVIIDITDRKRAEQAIKESEAQLKAIIHGSPNPQFVIDKNHQIIYWNKALAAITDIKAKDVLGTNLHWKAYYTEERPCMADLLVDGTPEKITEWFPQKSSKSKLADDAYETIDFFPKLGSGGKLLYVTAATIRDLNQNIIGALETIEDITDLKEAEETVINVNKKLNTLTNITHHEIIDQITACSGYIELLETVVPDEPEIKKQISKAKFTISSIQNLIKFAQDYQKLGEHAAGWHNLEQLIDKAIETINPQGVELQVKTGPIEVYADPLIEKVFCNLIDNSLHQGGQVTRINVTFKEAIDNGIILYEDDGKGIPQSLKNKLFKKGFGKRIGYGLYLSKEILNYTGIDIAETGEENKGTRFEIIIPKDLFRKSSAQRNNYYNTEVSKIAH